MASLHLISALKSMSEFELAGKFWEWVRQQDTSHCDARVYGSYIELLAYKGEPLAKMEELYMEAFDRYSNTASVSPQVARETGATHIILLQSIITARLLNGDWRSAYEAFDLILRLYPTATPARVYELFIYERPIREAFTVFLIACRAGTPPSASVLTPLMEEIWLKHRDVCALIRLCWAYSGAGGVVRSEHLNFLLKALLLSYPPHPPPLATPDELKSHSTGFTKLIASLRALIGCFEPLGIAIQATTFNTIISCGGKLGRGDLVLGALRDMVKAGIRPNDVTYRTLVVVAGHLKDEKQLVEAWRMLEATKMEERNARIQTQKKLIQMKRLSPDTVVGSVGVKWEFKDWQALVDACVLIGKERFAVEELDKWRDGGGVEAGGTNTPATALSPIFYTKIWDYFVHAKEREVLRAKERKDYPRPVPTTIAESSVKNMPALANTRNSTSPETGHVYTIDKTIDELRRLLQTFSTSSITAFSPPSSESPANTTNPTTGDPTKAPAYLPIDLDFTTPPHPPYPMSYVQQIYSSLLSTSPNTAAGQSPRYLGLGNTSDSDSVTTTGFTIRELRFQNWVAINKLLFYAELNERKAEAKLHRDVAKQSATGSQPKPQLKTLIWKEEQVHEWVKRVETQAKSEFSKGFDVDVDVRTGKINVKNDQKRQEMRKKLVEEAWNIRTIVGGGGLTWYRGDEKLKGEEEEIMGRKLKSLENEGGIGSNAKEGVEESLGETEENIGEKVKEAKELEQIEKMQEKVMREDAEKAEKTQELRDMVKTEVTEKGAEQVEQAQAEKLTEMVKEEKGANKAESVENVETGKEEKKKLERVERGEGEGQAKWESMENVARLEEKQKILETGKEEGKAGVRVKLKKEREEKKGKKMEKVEKLEKSRKKKEKETSKKVGRVGRKPKETIIVAQEDKKAENVEKLEVEAKETVITGKEGEEGENTYPRLFISSAPPTTSPTPPPPPATTTTQPTDKSTLTPTSSLGVLTPNYHIIQTTTEIPDGPPPSPEKLQQAMQELSAISEAESELADSIAELFTLTAHISDRKTTEAASGHKLVLGCGVNQSRVESTSPQVMAEVLHQPGIVVEAEPGFGEAEHTSASSPATAEAKSTFMHSSILTTEPQKNGPNALDPTPTPSPESNLEAAVVLDKETKAGENEVMSVGVDVDVDENWGVDGGMPVDTSGDRRIGCEVIEDICIGDKFHHSGVRENELDRFEDVDDLNENVDDLDEDKDDLEEWGDEDEEVEWQEDDQDEPEEGKVVVNKVKGKRKGNGVVEAEAKTTKSKATKPKPKAMKTKATKTKAKPTKDLKTSNTKTKATAKDKTTSTTAKKASGKMGNGVSKKNGGKKK